MSATKSIFLLIHFPFTFLKSDDMKKHILTIGLLFFVALVSAQKPVVKPTDASAKDEFVLFSKDTWMGRFQKGQEKMVKKLGLDEQQKRSLDTMNDIYVSQRAAFYDDKSIERRDRKADIEQLQKERYTKFQSLLTPEQRAKWEELRKGQKKKVFRKK
jgi:Spy/CpxP family protein refolding chaperone